VTVAHKPQIESKDKGRVEADFSLWRKFVVGFRAEFQSTIKISARTCLEGDSIYE